MLIASVSVASSVYRAAFALQLAFYALSLFAVFKRRCGPLTRVANAALALIVLNSAAVVAFANFVTGRREVWGR
jgi:multisubunit Na+/H+ antiporter MnhF subunit